MPGSGVVVVGIDESAVAEAALEFAAREAQLRDGELVVAHAAPPDEPGTAAEELRPFVEMLHHKAIAKVSAGCPELKCRFETRDVGATDFLIDLSEDAELVVVGTHRTGRLRGWVLGSVSQGVAAHASAPVVAVSSVVEHRSAPIVLGVSASAGGMAALRFACEEARLHNVPLRAVRSIIFEDWAFSGRGHQASFGTDFLEDAARAELDTVLATAKNDYPEVALSGEVARMDPFSALLKASQNAGLLVVGSRRYQAANLPHLGPVAGGILHQATCPVAVVGFERFEQG